MQLAEIAVIKAFRDEQHCIGTSHAGLDQLVSVEKEVLAEHRNLRRLTNGREILEVALKELNVCEDADACCPVLFVRFRDLDWLKVISNHPLAGAGLHHQEDQH